MGQGELDTRDRDPGRMDLGEIGEMDLDELGVDVAQMGEHVHEDVEGIAIDDDPRESLVDPDVDAAGLRFHGTGDRRRHPRLEAPAIALVAPRHHGVERRRILHRARHRPDGVHGRGEGIDPVEGDAAVGRLQARERTRGRRISDRAGCVAAAVVHAPIDLASMERKMAS